MPQTKNYELINKLNLQFRASQFKKKMGAKSSNVSFDKIHMSQSECVSPVGSLHRHEINKKPKG